MSVASVALLKSAAKYLTKDVFEHLHEQVSLLSEEGEKAEKKTIRLPIPAITLISGGKTGPGKKKYMLNILVLPQVRDILQYLAKFREKF